MVVYYVLIVVAPPLGFLLSMGIGPFMVLTVAWVRGAVRAKYSIGDNGQGALGTCRDYACALFCQSCVVMQMARHASNYEKERAAWCTPDGLTAGREPTSVEMRIVAV